MPGFIAREEVEELSYDFEPFVEGAKGRISEPTADQIQNFRKALAEMLEESLPETDALPVPGNESDEAESRKMTRALIAAIGRDQTEAQEKALHMIADVCSGKPSFDDLNALPWRHQQAFSGWLSQKLLLPQTSTPATNSSAAGVPTGRSSTSPRAN